ncbi:MAG: hypothetical protein P3X22_006100 [Thermoprotei archaeon]|nr:hypothetical protein [Thermoprotei archaeon]
MAEKKIELTKEAWKTCTDKPSVKLMMTLEEASEGDVVVVVGEEDFAPSSMVMKIVGRWDVEVIDFDSDGYLYTLKVRKAKG